MQSHSLTLAYFEFSRVTVVSKLFLDECDLFLQRISVKEVFESGRKKIENDPFGFNFCLLFSLRPRNYVPIIKEYISYVVSAL